MKTLDSTHRVRLNGGPLILLAGLLLQMWPTVAEGAPQDGEHEAQRASASAPSNSNLVRIDVRGDADTRLRISQPIREGTWNSRRKAQGDHAEPQPCTGIIDEGSGVCLELVTDEEMADPCYPGTVVPGVLSATGNPVCRDCPNNSSLPGCILIEYDCGHGALDNSTGSCVCDPGWSVSPVTDQCSIFATSTPNSEGLPGDDSSNSGRLESGALRPGVQLKRRAQPIWLLQDTIMSSIAFAIVGLWFFFARRTDLF